MNKNSKLFTDYFPYAIFALTASLTVFLLIGIFIFLFITGISALTSIAPKDFFLGINWDPTSYNKPAWGILSLVIGTCLVSVIALFIAVPFGFSIAIYLSEIMNAKVKKIIKPIIEMIASIPSVVLGLIGLLFLSPFIAKIFHLPNGLIALTAAILVAIAALPTIASMSQDAFSSVPNSLRESSLALGATKWTTIVRVVIPAAKSGLLASVMLGLGRIIGETVIVLMVAGNIRALPHSIFDSVSPMTSTIAIDIQEVVVGSLHWQALFAIGFILFIMTFLINFLADIMINKK